MDLFSKEEYAVLKKFAKEAAIEDRRLHGISEKGNDENKTLPEKYREYSVIKQLYKTKKGELFLVSKNVKNDKLYLLNKIEIKTLETKKFIENEIKSLKQVDSKFIMPIVVEYFSFTKKEIKPNIKEKEFFCIIIDYYENNLFKLIYESNFLNSKNIWKFFIQIIIALNSLKLNNLLPNNLFPENIYIDKDNNIKLGGIGLYLDLMRNNESEIDILSYNSPEVIKGEKIDEKNILWSAGCILYELTFKKRAFIDKNYKTLENNILQLNYDLPFECEKDISLIIQKLLCEKKKRVSLDELIFDDIFKRKLIEINLFPYFLKANLQGK